MGLCAQTPGHIVVQEKGFSCTRIVYHKGLLPQLLDIVYSIEINSYRGRSNVQLILKDFRFAK